MNAKQDETKKFIDFDLDINDNFEFCLNEVIAGATDDKIRALQNKADYCFGRSTRSRSSTE